MARLRHKPVNIPTQSFKAGLEISESFAILFNLNTKYCILASKYAFQEFFRAEKPSEKLVFIFAAECVKSLNVRRALFTTDSSRNGGL